MPASYHSSLVEGQWFFNNLLGRPIEEGPRTLKELVDHWLDTECPGRDEDPNERRAFSTRDNYRGYLRKWVKPRWGDQSLDQVKAVAVESWLSTLKKDNVR